MSVFTESAEVKNRTYLENDLVFAYLTHMPITPGHTLVIPKREVATFEELYDDELLSMRSLAVAAMDILRLNLGAEGFNCAWNQGEGYGQSVSHFHLHIVPRTPDDAGIVEYEPRNFLYRPGSRAMTPESELAEIAAQLRQESV